MVENNYQNYFFSKELIYNLNKIILDNNPNFQSEKIFTKQDIVNLLIKNMKQVYKAINESKINDKNFTSILDQFKKHSVNETLNELKDIYKKKYVSNSTLHLPDLRFNEDKSHSSAEIKFNRDFISNIPKNNSQFFERPIATKLNSNKDIDIDIDSKSKSRIMSYENNNIVNTSNNFNENINIKNQYSKQFNNLNQIQSLRNSEINKNTRPKTPDFLKAQKSNPNKPDKIEKSNTQFEFKSNDNFNDGFLDFSNDIGDNLFSIDNIDKPLITTDIIEDNTNFEDRLKKLQRERENFQPQNENQDNNNEKKFFF